MTIYRAIAPAYYAYCAQVGAEFKPWTLFEFGEWMRYSPHFSAFEIITSRDIAYAVEISRRLRCEQK